MRAPFAPAKRTAAFAARNDRGDPSVETRMCLNMSELLSLERHPHDSQQDEPAIDKSQVRRQPPKAIDIGQTQRSPGASLQVSLPDPGGRANLRWHSEAAKRDV